MGKNDSKATSAQEGEEGEEGGNGKERKWIIESRAVRKSLGFSETVKPWTGRGDKACPGIMLAREKELLDICFMRFAKAAGINNDADLLSFGNTAPNIFVDVSQSVARMRFCENSLPTVLKSSRFYSYAADRMITSTDYLLICDHDPALLQACSEFESRNMLGEAIPLQLMGCVLYPIVKLWCPKRPASALSTTITW